MVAFALTIGMGAAIAPAATAAPTECAWPVITDPEKTNVAYPDTSATYWTTPYRVEPGTQLIVNGQYPQARFFSFNTYDSSGGAFSYNGVESGIVDYQVNPSADSKNPWQQPVKNPTNKNNRFEVTVQGDVSPGTSNTIPLAPAGTADGAPGFLILRVYLPQGGDFSSLVLPSITVLSGANTKTLLPCKKKQQQPPTQALQDLLAATGGEIVGRVLGSRSGPCTTSCPPELEFARASAATTNSVFPNSASAYVSALFTPKHGQVVLVRAKAPRTPALVAPGTEPQPWPSKKYQLQYYSLCNNLYREPWPVIINDKRRGAQDLGCRADNATNLDKRGRFTYVVGPQSKKRAISHWSTATFVPYSQTEPRLREVLIFRNMLANPNFQQSAMNAPQNMNAQDAAAVMGQYYPHAKTCPLRFYLDRGPNACFRR